MSLDVYLKVGEDRIEQCERCDGTGKINHGRERVYDANITHNLNKMADAAGIYQALWRPEEIGITKAGQLAPLLRDGLKKLEADPEKFKQFNPPNGWGDYDGLVSFVRRYLVACEDYPDADVDVFR